MVIGRVSITRIGFTIAFKNASTSEKIIAVINESMCMCGVNINDKPYATAAVMRRRKRNLIIF